MHHSHTFPELRTSPLASASMVIGLRHRNATKLTRKDVPAWHRSSGSRKFWFTHDATCEGAYLGSIGIPIERSISVRNAQVYLYWSHPQPHVCISDSECPSGTVSNRNPTETGENPCEPKRCDFIFLFFSLRSDTKKENAVRFRWAAFSGPMYCCLHLYGSTVPVRTTQALTVPHHSHCRDFGCGSMIFKVSPKLGGKHVGTTLLNE